jgi:superfamily II DNA or RNA helicase
MRYVLPVREPGRAYLDRDLWLPKRLVSTRAIARRLTFKVYEGRKKEAVSYVWAFRESRHHLVVPRNFMTPAEVFSRYGLRVEDRRKTDFEKITVLHDVVPRDYQVKPMELLRKLEVDGTLSLGCGKGKTVLGLWYAAYLAVPTLIICGNGSILKGWERELQDKFRFQGDVGWFHGPKKKWEGCPFVLATPQTLSSQADELPPEFLTRWGLVLFDEGHHFSANTFCRTANLFHGRRLALTATPKRNDGLEPIYQAHLGGVFYRDVQQELTPRIIFLHSSGYSLRVPKGIAADNTLLHTWLANDKTFNREIIKETKEALRNRRAVIGLSHRVGQLLTLEAAVKGSRAVYGELSLADREDALENGNPIWGTTQLAQEGLNVPRLDTLLVLTLFANENSFEQTIGRILRTHKGKQAPTVVIFVPDITKCQKQASRLKGFARRRGWPVEDHKT